MNGERNFLRLFLKGSVGLVGKETGIYFSQGSSTKLLVLVIII